MIADEQNGVQNCVKLLAGKGRKNLTFVVDQDTPSNRLKQQGFEAGVVQFCGGTEPVVVRTEQSNRGAYDATVRLMQTHPQTDGIVYAVDLHAVVGMRALADCGVAVPGRVSVIGVDNSLYAELSTPKLNSLDNMRYDLSLMAVRNLISVLQGEHVNKKMMIYSSIVERESN